MRHFKENDLTVLFDIGRERILEEAISCLLESGGNVTRGVELFKERKKVLLDKPGDGYYSYLKDIESLLEHPKTAVEGLKELLPEEIDWLAKAEFGIPDNLFDQMICPKDMRALNRTPAGLYLSLSAGYAFDANSGITSGLKSYNKDLHSMVKEIWEHAIEELHPFQRGPTHQGTKHCIQVLNNLHALKQDLNITTFHDVVWAMLSVAAGLHDIGKGDIIVASSKHAKKGADVIEHQPASLELAEDFKEFVAEIVRTHNPEIPFINIDQLNPRNISHSVWVINVPNVDMRQVCALFQLADVLDITRDRVSNAILEMLQYLYSDPVCGKHNDFNDIKKIIEARKGIAKWTIMTGTDNYIKVNLSDQRYKKAVEDRIKEENDDLAKTGAKDVLKGLDWPWLRT